jgi:hypothetical protein
MKNKFCDLRVLNQAWYIACDECVVEIDRKQLTNQEAFHFIIERCSRDAKGLLDVAREEVRKLDITGEGVRRI